MKVGALATGSFIEGALQPRLVWGWLRWWCLRLSGLGTQQQVNDPRALLEVLAHLAATLRPRLHNLLEPNHAVGQLLTDRPTEEAVVVVDADLAQVLGVIANDDA